MNRFLNKFTDVFDDFLAGFMAVMLILTFANVIARYIFLSSLNFVEEITVAGMVILTYAGASSAAKKDAHISLSLLYDRVSPPVQRIFKLIEYVLSLGFSAILLYRSFLMVQTQVAVNQLSATMGWPQWIYSMWLPIGALVMLVIYLQLTVNQVILIGKKRGVEGE